MITSTTTTANLLEPLPASCSNSGSGRKIKNTLNSGNGSSNNNDHNNTSKNNSGYQQTLLHDPPPPHQRNRSLHDLFRQQQPGEKKKNNSNGYNDKSNCNSTNVDKEDDYSNRTASTRSTSTVNSTSYQSNCSDSLLPPGDDEAAEYTDEQAIRDNTNSSPCTAQQEQRQPIVPALDSREKSRDLGTGGASLVALTLESTEVARTHEDEQKKHLKSTSKNNKDSLRASTKTTTDTTNTPTTDTTTTTKGRRDSHNSSSKSSTKSKNKSHPPKRGSKTSSAGSPSSTSTSARKRTVRFAHPMASTVGTIPCLSQLSSEERWETWWCPHEYQAIRLAAKYSTKQIRKCDTLSAECVQRIFSFTVRACGVGIVDNIKEMELKKSTKSKDVSKDRKIRIGDLDDSYDVDDDDQAEHEEFEDEEYNDDKLVNPATSIFSMGRPRSNSMPSAPENEDEVAVSLLESWCTSKLPTRGLEKYVSLQHKKDRVERMNESRRIVAQLSSSFSSLSRGSKDKSGTSSPNGASVSSDAATPVQPEKDPAKTSTHPEKDPAKTPAKQQELEQEIARVYSQYVQYAHMFARFMGEADARAAQQAARDMASLEDNDNDDDSLVRSNQPWAEQRRRNFQQRGILHRSSSMQSGDDGNKSRTQQDSLLQQYLPMAGPNTALCLSSSLHDQTNARLWNHHNKNQVHQQKEKQQQQQKQHKSCNTANDSGIAPSINGRGKRRNSITLGDIRASFSKSSISSKPTASSSTLTNGVIMVDESVKASISTTTKQSRRNSNNKDSANVQLRSSSSHGAEGSNNHKTHLERSFSRRNLLQRRASLQGLQQNQEDSLLLSSSSKVDVAVSTRESAQDLLQRSDSRRALMRQNRQNSFHCQTPHGQLSSSTAQQQLTSSTQQQPKQSMSRRGMLQAHRQESMKRNKNTNNNIVDASSAQHGATRTLSIGNRRFSLTST